MNYLKETCYLCLSDSNTSFIHLFSRSEQDSSENLSYFNKISITLSQLATILKEIDCDYLVCEECCKTIDRIYEFNSTCLNNVLMITSYSGNIKDEIQGQRCDNVETDAVLVEDINNEEYLDGINEIFLEDEFQDADSEDRVNILHNELDKNIENFETNVGDEHILTVVVVNEIEHQNCQEKSYICEICGKMFETKSNWKKHNKMSHMDDKPYICHICRVSFKFSSNLNKHLLVHTNDKSYGEKNYLCDQCGKSFSQKPHLVTHKRLHTGEKPYKCNECEKTFSEKVSLERHKRVHTGDRPYKCEQCNKQFRQIGHLVKHQLSHTGEKKFVCDLCNSAFIQNGDLARHKRIHLGEKPYCCEVCSKSFVRRTHLNRHKLIHTKQKSKCQSTKKV